MATKSLASGSICFLFLLFLSFPVSGDSIPGADNAPIAVVAATDRASVNGAPAGTGTTLFPGDVVEAKEGPVLVMFFDGNRVELVKASAKFISEGNSQVIFVNHGLVRFNFKRQHNIRIITSRYLFMPKDRGEAVGAIVVNASGQTAMSICRGALTGIEAARPVQTAITDKAPLVDLSYNGEGRLQKGGNELVDASRHWKEDELAGHAVFVGDEKHKVVSNNETTLIIDGGWTKSTGSYTYQTKDPGKTALRGATLTTASLAGMIGCMTPHAVAAISPAAAAGAAGTAILFTEATKSETGNPE